MTTFGAEIEKPISDIATGNPKGLSQKSFNGLAEKYSKVNIDYSDTRPDTIIGISTPEMGHIGLDNGFNLQETSTRVTQSLGELEDLIKIDLATIQEVLAREGATVINMSIHPMGKTDRQTHRLFVAPKGVYKYIALRGWDHAAGIDAKAQNSPCTGIEPENAAKSVSTIIGASAAFIGIFANSPFAEGKLSEFKETRLTMWERFMKDSISQGDRVTANFPEKPFNSLRDYFTWMFGYGTNIHFVMASGSNYKTFGDGAILIENNPSVLEYLALDSANGNLLNSGDNVLVKPHLRHLEALQFAQFTSARIRWTFNHDNIDKEGFLDALKQDSLEELFRNGAVSNVYIEGRDPGANFPDTYLKSLGNDLSWSTVMGPSALQAGLLHNLDESSAYIGSFKWQHLGLLRMAAIKSGLQGEACGVSVYDFAKNILNIASRGLSNEDGRMLVYPEHVLRTEQNGADRALYDYIEKGLSIQDIVKSRNVTL